MKNFVKYVLTINLMIITIAIFTVYISHADINPGTKTMKLYGNESGTKYCCKDNGDRCDPNVTPACPEH